MTSGVVFALALALLAIVIVAGFLRRKRELPGDGRSAADGPTAVAQWTEGETTRLLSSAEAAGPLSAAPAVPLQGREASVLPVAQGRVPASRDLRPDPPRRRAAGEDRPAGHGAPARIPQDREPARRLRRLRPRHDDRRDRRRARARSGRSIRATRSSRSIKQRCLQAAQVKYVCVYPPQLPRYRELREQILGPAADLL